MAEPPSYVHTQPGTLVRWTFAAALAATAATALGREWLPVVIGIALLICAALSLFHALSVEVDRAGVRLRFGIGLIRKSIPLSSIRSAREVRNRWWYGWGIRLTPHGWLWNVSGLGAVELELESGRRFRIGSDEPQRLHAAIESVLKRR